jgi:hypothetical protein
MTVRKQDRNGVKVRVHEHENGTWVEADCQCFGSPLRLHSNMDCPVRLRAVADAERANTSEKERQ